MINTISKPLYCDTCTMEYYSAIKNNKIMPIAAAWDRPRDCHTEWSKSDTERQISNNIAYTWDLKRKEYKWTYLQNRNKVTDVENKFVVTRG